MVVAWTTVMGNEGEERWMADSMNGTEVTKQHVRSKTRKYIALSSKISDMEIYNLLKIENSKLSRLIGHSNPYCHIANLALKTMCIIFIRIPRPFNGGKESLFNKRCWKNFIFSYKRMS